MNKNEIKQFWIFLAEIAGRQTEKLIILLIIILGGVGISNVLPYLYGKIIDQIELEQMREIQLLMFLYFATALIAISLGAIESFIGTYLSYTMTSNIKRRLIKKIVYLRCGELDKFNDGELLSRLNGDAGTAVDYVLNVATSVLTIIFNLIIALFFLLRMSFHMAMLVLTFVSTSVISNFIFKKKYRFLQQELKNYGDRMSSFQVDLFHNLVGIKAYQQEQNKLDLYDVLLNEKWIYDKKGCVLGNFSKLINTVISIGGTLCLVYISAQMIIVGEFTLGGMVAFLSYVSRLNQAVEQYLSLKLDAQGVIVCMERIRALEAEEDEYEYVCGKKGLEFDIQTLYKDIHINNVSFSYGGENRMVLNECSLNIEQNGFYSVVGENGCGKSTLLKLLVRFYDYTNGEIIIGNKKIIEENIFELRRQIAYIPKEAYFTNQSIEENLKLLNPKATTREVEKVIEQVGLSDFINGLPHGIKSRVGEKGKLLSSGQKQKISIARAILANPNIYLFDEITSDLDGKAEWDILQIMRQLSENKIILQVTHRVPAVINSDLIFLMENGKISNSGKHEKLLQESKLYRDMFLHQQLVEDCIHEEA